MIPNCLKVPGIILGFLLVGLLVFVGSAAAAEDPATATDSLGPVESASAGSGAVVPAAAATLNKTLYLHNTSVAFTINTVATIRYMDTIANASISGGASVYANKNIVGTTWIAYPVMADDLTLVNSANIKIWVNRTGTNSGGTFSAFLWDLDPAGSQTLIASTTGFSPSGSSLGFPNAPTEHTVTIDLATPYTVLAGHSIIAGFDLTANNAGWYTIQWGNATFPSRVTIQTLEHADPAEVLTLNPAGVSQTVFNATAITPEITVWSNVTDPFGTYDISNVTVEILDGTGATVVTETDMSKIYGFFNDFNSTWEFTFNHTGWDIGRYTARVRVVDNAGFYSRYPSNPGDTTWGGHLMILDRDFWIGVQPNAANITVVDSLGDPVENVKVDAGGGVWNWTDSSGFTVIQVNDGQVVDLYFQGVQVGPATVGFTSDRNATLDASIYHPVFLSLDSNADPVSRVVYFVTHANGTPYPATFISDGNGQIDLGILAAGDYQMQGYLRSINVFDNQVSVDRNGNINLNVAVFTLDVTVVDSTNASNPLGNVVVSLYESSTGILTDARLTAPDGTVSFIIPGAVYAVEANLNALLVANRLDYLVSADQNLVLKASLFEVNLTVVDQALVAVANAEVRVLDSNGVIIAAKTTDSLGLVSLRLIAGNQTFLVTWEGSVVYDAQETVTGNHIWQRTVDIWPTTMVLQDDVGDPLQGANLLMTNEISGLTLVSEVTDATGRIAIRVPGGQYETTVSWSGIIVFTRTVTVDTLSDIIITTDVFAISITVEDVDGGAVGDVQLHFEHIATGLTILAGSSPAIGTLDALVPGGDYQVTATWREVGVLDEIRTIAASGPILLNVTVYPVTFVIQDQDGIALDAATLEVVHIVSGRLMTGGSTGSARAGGDRLPGAAYQVTVEWLGVVVLDETLVLANSGDQVYQAAVVTIDFLLMDLDDVPVADAAFVATHNASALDLLTGATDTGGRIGARLPMGTYTVFADWEAVTVVKTTVDLNVSGTITLATDVASFTITLEDSRQVGVGDATVTLTYADLGKMVSLTTDATGVTSVRLPVWNYTIATTWMGVTVGTFEHFNDNRDPTLVVTVSYIDVSVVDRKGAAYAGAELKVFKGEAIIAGTVSDGNGVAVFRLPDQPYRVQLDYQDTQWWTYVAETHEQTITLSGDQTVAFELTDFPVPIYKRILLWVMVILLAMLGLLIWLLVSGRKGSAEEQASDVGGTSGDADGKSMEATGDDTAAAAEVDAGGPDDKITLNLDESPVPGELSPPPPPT